MTDITQVTDHATRAAGRLLAQFDESVTHAGLFNAMATQAQEVEDALYELRYMLSIANSEGDGLDKIGELLGAARDGRTDTNYRLRLRAQILINRRSGEIETLISVVKLLIPDWADPVVVTLTEPSPATMTLEATPAVDLATSAEAYKVLRTAKAGGVRLELFHNTDDDADMFAFAGGTGLGFDDGTGTVGGEMAKVYGS